MTTPTSPPALYRRRILDDELDVLVGGLPAVSIEGAKAVGKTATATERATTVFSLDDPAIVEIVRGDPSRLVTTAGTTLIDEWQRFPESWDLVRRAVDKHRGPGRFLLTGSATPRAGGTHSGAGRIVSVRMRPMTMPERGLDDPTVSLALLLAGGKPALRGSTRVGLADYAHAIVHGGFPGMQASEARAHRAELGAYVDRIVDRDVPEAGLAIRNPRLLRRWLAAHAAATGTTASYETLRNAATPGQADKPARSTTTPYQDALERIWVSEPLPGWLPSRYHLTRLTLAPKHHLVDPALAVAVTGLDLDGLLEGRAPEEPIPRDGTFLGALFESLVTSGVRVFAQAAEARVHHLRTKGGEREVDLIVTGPDQAVVAIEVKLARTVEERDLRHLRWLSDTMGPALTDALVVTTGPEAYRRTDGIGVVPAALLGP